MHSKKIVFLFKGNINGTSNHCFSIREIIERKKHSKREVWQISRLVNLDNGIPKSYHIAVLHLASGFELVSIMK